MGLLILCGAKNYQGAAQYIGCISPGTGISKAVETEIERIAASYSFALLIRNTGVYQESTSISGPTS